MDHWSVWHQQLLLLQSDWGSGPSWGRIVTRCCQTSKSCNFSLSYMIFLEYGICMFTWCYITKPFEAECLLLMIGRLRKQYWKVWRGGLIHRCGMHSISVTARSPLRRYFCSICIQECFPLFQQSLLQCVRCTFSSMYVWTVTIWCLRGEIVW